MIYGKRYTVLPPETGANFSYTDRLISVKPHGKKSHPRGVEAPLSARHHRHILRALEKPQPEGPMEGVVRDDVFFFFFYVGVFLDRPFFWKHGPGVGQVFFS